MVEVRCGVVVNVYRLWNYPKTSGDSILIDKLYSLLFTRDPNVIKSRNHYRFIFRHQLFPDLSREWYLPEYRLFNR